ncbi:uncharacterized protein F5147DRAFT_566220 [Suillus discolor]|uniref:Uncharacterized protein n=1 Tax=Suillus discolor TaxID=1912936 RepID=A0A9P7FI05_9AGAM|nr:uncharacterized protein F5147DRAFT_566220 [Suillus discolor]KAG2117851.1 hypothetical protein F5147DRAFT_566220 [Suillus discolor]
MTSENISSTSYADCSTCGPPKLHVRSLPDGTEFQVSRHVIETCEVFRNMFACCDHGVGDNDKPRPQEAVLHLDETEHALATLFRLIQEPPEPPPTENPDEARPRFKLHAGSIIPFPVLPSMLHLADKYGLPETIICSLHLHVQANASINPLPVYAYATAHDLPKIAAEASAHLLHPPFSSYTKEDIRIIPTVTAYHELLRLHEYRKYKLRDILLNEDIFPHGYGTCPVHKQWATQLWEQKRVYLATQIEAATDIAGEMRDLAAQLSSCPLCRKALTAALDMLQYKCRRVARTVDYVPQGYWLDAI